ncbi:hypothetical protein [Pandoraea pnomenusa]|uniref:hypothetical protein n=1 Tax=Pandoraea pnomenusa TaxID=93220 RepID=UPI003340A3E8
MITQRLLQAALECPSLVFTASLDQREIGLGIQILAVQPSELADRSSLVALQRSQLAMHAHSLGSKARLCSDSLQTSEYFRQHWASLPSV